MIIDNLNLIHKVINDLHLTYSNKDEYQDYYDSGLLGLLKGVKSYSRDKAKLSTFLYKCIRNAILLGLRIKTQKKHYNEAGKNISLNEIIYDDYRMTWELIDFIPDSKVNIEKEVQQSLEKERLLYAIDKVLTPYQAKIICMRYGLRGYSAMTFKDIGNKYGYSKQAIQSVERRAIIKLREYLTFNNDDVFKIKKEIREVNK